MAPPSESNTAPTCFLVSSVSFEIVARISDLVGAAFFFAILNLLLMFASAGVEIPQIQLGAENNIEKSRCLAQLRKKIRASFGAGYLFFRLPRGLEALRPRAVPPRSQ